MTMGSRPGSRCSPGTQPPDAESARRWLAAEAEAARELAGRIRFPAPEPVMVCYCYAGSNPAMSGMGRRTLERLAES